MFFSAKFSSPSLIFFWMEVPYSPRLVEWFTKHTIDDPGVRRKLFELGVRDDPEREIGYITGEDLQGLKLPPLQSRKIADIVQQTKGRQELEPWSIPSSMLHLDTKKKIGTGSFGDVYKV
jgi:hypothetical protein